MVMAPDTNDDVGWRLFYTHGIPHYNQYYAREEVNPNTKMYALSYKHVEHEHGRLSPEQADELRGILRHEVGAGPNKALIWVDRMYMMREGLGLQAFSDDWAKYGLMPYLELEVICLYVERDRRHPGSGKQSGWLWLEHTLGSRNQGIITVSNGFIPAIGSGFTRRGAYFMWRRDATEDFGFRGDDERALEHAFCG